MRPRLLSGAITGVTAGLLAGGAAYAAMYPKSQIFGPVLVGGHDPEELALTFDDGPNPTATPGLLELLDRYRVRATFFLIGSFVRQQRALARDIASAGHLIGNHTMTHPRLAFQSGARIRDELRGTKELLEDVLGQPVRFFRPPHGARRPIVLRAAAELGMTTVMWNVTASDWNPIGGEAISANIASAITQNQRRNRGSNILLHDGSHRGLGADRLATIEATQTLLERHSREHFVTVDRWAASVGE